MLPVVLSENRKVSFANSSNENRRLITGDKPVLTRSSEDQLNLVEIGVIFAQCWYNSK